jgi:hypothetical protein
MTDQNVNHQVLDTDQRTALGDMNTAIDAYKAEHSKAAGGTLGLHPDARESLRQAGNSIGAGYHAAVTGREDADATSRDDTIASAGKSRIIGEQMDKARSDSAQLFNNAEAHLSVAEARMTVDAIRPVSQQNAMTARHDLQMVLQNLSPEDAASRMVEMAKRSDDVGALAASQFGADYLTMRGAENVQELHGAARRAHLEVQADSGDDNRRANARNALAIPRMRKALAAAQSAAGFALQ